MLQSSQVPAQTKPWPPLRRVLSSERLALRPYELGDIAQVYSYAREPAWIEHQPLPRPYTKEHADRFVAQMILLDWQREPTWALVHEGAVVGGVRLGLTPEDRKADLGFSIAPRLWGLGLATEATSRVVAAAFKTLPELARVEAHTTGDNLGCQRVLDKIGMTREGRLRKAKVIDDRLVDLVFYGLLREDWLEV